MDRKALVVDDHPITHVGCYRLLSQIGFETVLEARDENAAMTLAQQEMPDVVLLDISLNDSNGLDLIKPLLEVAPKAVIVVFSMKEHMTFAARALATGAKGYLSKNAPPEEFHEAIETVLAGDTYLHHDFALRLATISKDPMTQLTKREEEVLRRLGQGMDLQAIADQLNVSYKTVANMISNLKTKLGVSGINGLIKAALTYY